MTEPPESYKGWTDEQKWSYLLRRERLGELLVRQGKLTIGQLEEALAQQAKTGNTRHIGEIVVDLKLLTLDEIIACLDRQTRIKQTSDQVLKQLKNKNKD